MLRAGFVGLPNVGKTTLFNAVTAQSSALIANYAFSTSKPNVGVVAVPDERLAPLAKSNYRSDMDRGGQLIAVAIAASGLGLLFHPR